MYCILHVIIVNGYLSHFLYPGDDYKLEKFTTIVKAYETLYKKNFNNVLNCVKISVLNIFHGVLFSYRKKIRNVKLKRINLFLNIKHLLFIQSTAYDIKTGMK